jgi:hypothetical protein
VTKPTTTDREWKQLRQVAWSRKPVRNGYGYCFFDNVVVRINQFADNKPLRTIVLPTGGTSSRGQDTVRCQRLFRRLRKWAGVRTNTSLSQGRECDGIFGTVFAHTA